jgi:glycosyltransferase involved in cell wall biosynthesis
MSQGYKYSAIIPVYNSASFISKTIERTVAFFEVNELDYEVVLVNDGSPDNVWEVLVQEATRNGNLKVVNLMKNYGQHTAIYCGMQVSDGDFIITLDDDLQNPPEEMINLIHKIHEGYDLVFGKFISKKHAGYRKLGTKLINYLNTKIFNKPADLVLSNFRIFSSRTKLRALKIKSKNPYIPGLLLMSASKMANVDVRHDKREVGTSNYSTKQIIALVSRLLFNYSSFPLKMLTYTGGFVSLLAFSIGSYHLVKALFVGAAVPGWSTIVVLLSFFNGFLILMLGVMGEYLVRILNQISSETPYEIDEIIYETRKQH